MKVNVQGIFESSPGKVKLNIGREVSFTGVPPLKGRRIKMYVVRCH